MPPLKSNPNVIIPHTPEETEELKARSSELDCYYISILSGQSEYGGIVMRAFVPAGSTPNQILPSMIKDGFPRLPYCFFDASQETKARQGLTVDQIPYLPDNLQMIREWLVSTGQVAPNRKAEAADKIRALFGMERKYGSMHTVPRDYSKSRSYQDLLEEAYGR